VENKTDAHSDTLLIRQLTNIIINVIMTIIDGSFAGKSKAG